MIPVLQDRFGKPGGNCFEACVASILECELADLPYFDGPEPGQWFVGLQAFLEPHGLHAIIWDIENCGDWRPPGYWIGGIRTRHGHACVFHGGALVHNPHPPYTPETTDLRAFPLMDMMILTVIDIEKLQRSEIVGKSRRRGGT